MSSVEGKERDVVRGRVLPGSLPHPPPLLAATQGHCCIPGGGKFWGVPGPGRQILTLLNAEAAGPLLQGDVLVVVQVTGLEEAGGAVLHGDEGGAQRGQLGVGQVPAGDTQGQRPSSDLSCSPSIPPVAQYPSQYPPVGILEVKDGVCPCIRLC